MVSTKLHFVNFDLSIQRDQKSPFCVHFYKSGHLDCQLNDEEISILRNAVRPYYKQRFDLYMSKTKKFFYYNPGMDRIEIYFVHF